MSFNTNLQQLLRGSIKGCAAAVAAAPIYLLAGSFADPFPHSLIGREPFFSRRSDPVTPDMLFDLVMHRAGHFHAPIYVPEGPLDVVGCLSDSLDSVVEPHFCLPLQRKMQRVRKVYVCSSHRVAGDPNNFTMELKQDVDMGEKAHMAVRKVNRLCIRLASTPSGTHSSTVASAMAV